MSATLLFCQEHKYGWAVKKHLHRRPIQSFCDRKNVTNVTECRIHIVAHLRKGKGKVKEKIFLEGLHLTYAYKLLFDTIIADKKGNSVDVPWLTHYLQTFDP